MTKAVYDYRDYKCYLSDTLATSGMRRGMRSKLATFLGCQTAFVSQVLTGNAEFSLEHAIRINDFLQHTLDEAHFFMLLVHFGRAGSKLLAEYYRKQIDQVLDKRQRVRESIKVNKTLSLEDQITYYSSWHYAAIHVLAMIPEFRTKTSIADYLQIPLRRITECVEFLSRAGILAEERGKLRVESTRIHLRPDSPMIAKHHINWRMHAIRSLDGSNHDDLHYSSVISLSKEDAEQIRKILLNALAQSEALLKDSKDEMAFCYSFDFFRL